MCSLKSQVIYRSESGIGQNISQINSGPILTIVLFCDRDWEKPITSAPNHRKFRRAMPLTCFWPRADLIDREVSSHILMNYMFLMNFLYIGHLGDPQNWWHSNTFDLLFHLGLQSDWCEVYGHHCMNSLMDFHHICCIHLWYPWKNRVAYQPMWHTFLSGAENWNLAIIAWTAW